MTTFSAKGFLFDMDGTLVDSRALVEKIWINFCAQNKLDAQEVIAWAHGRQVFDTLSHLLGEGESTIRATAVIEEIERTSLDGLVAIKGAAELLAALPSDRIALVTSAGKKVAENRMQAAGLPLPAVMICAEDVVTGKPVPEGYLKAAAALGIEIQDCVVFEDADAGIQAGLASGAKVIAVVPNALGSSESHFQAELININVEELAGEIRLIFSECVDR